MKIIKKLSHYIIKKILEEHNVFYNINNLELFQRSFVHKSYVKPKILNEDVIMAIKPPNCIELKNDSNERLEFLGDGILECITKFYLYKRFPNEDEGFMTEKKFAWLKTTILENWHIKWGCINIIFYQKMQKIKKLEIILKNWVVYLNHF